MKKLKLDLGTLQVQSFELGAEGRRGTVQGQQDTWDGSCGSSCPPFGCGTSPETAWECTCGGTCMTCQTLNCGWDCTENCNTPFGCTAIPLTSCC